MSQMVKLGTFGEAENFSNYTPSSPFGKFSEVISEDGTCSSMYQKNYVFLMDSEFFNWKWEISVFFLKPKNLDSMGSRRFLLWLLVVWTAPGTGCLCRAAGWKFCVVRGPVEDPQSCGGSNNTRHSAKRWGFSRVIFQGGEQEIWKTYHLPRKEFNFQWLLLSCVFLVKSTIGELWWRKTHNV